MSTVVDLSRFERITAKLISSFKNSPQMSICLTSGTDGHQSLNRSRALRRLSDANGGGFSAAG